MGEPTSATVPRPLVDSFGRVHTDLRISVTDRCNFRCTYCMPEEGLAWLPREAVLSFELLARPALRRIAGHVDLRRPEIPAIAAEDFPRRPDGKVHFVRVVAARADDGGLQVRSAGGQGSHHLTAMARAHALAVLPDGDGVITGDDVEVIPLAWPE